MMNHRELTVDDSQQDNLQNEVIPEQTVIFKTVNADRVEVLDQPDNVHVLTLTQQEDSEIEKSKADPFADITIDMALAVIGRRIPEAREIVILNSDKDPIASYGINETRT